MYIEKIIHKLLTYLHSRQTVNLPDACSVTQSQFISARSDVYLYMPFVMFSIRISIILHVTDIKAWHTAATLRGITAEVSEIQAHLPVKFMEWLQ
jgi:hypothetical protein